MLCHLRLVDDVTIRTYRAGCSRKSHPGLDDAPAWPRYLYPIKPVHTGDTLTTGGHAMTATLITGTYPTRASALPAHAALAWSWPLPAGSMIALVENRAELPAVVQALTNAGVRPDGITIRSGAGGAARLREAYAGRGFFARLKGVIEDDGEIAGRLQAACARGAAVLLLRVPGHVHDAALTALDNAGARVIRRAGGWTFAGTGGHENGR